MNYNDKLEEIKRYVAEYYDVPAESLVSTVRDIPTAQTRQVILYLARTRLALPLQDIARAFDLTHATIIHSCKLVAGRIKSDENLKRDVEEISRRLDAEDESSPSAVSCEPEDAHWRRVMMFLQESGMVIDYLLRRVYAKRLDEDVSEPVLYAATADDDGELTDELIVRYVSSIARSAQRGFVDVDGFPVFGSIGVAEGGAEP